MRTHMIATSSSATDPQTCQAIRLRWNRHFGVVADAPAPTPRRMSARVEAKARQLGVFRLAGSHNAAYGY